MLIKIKKIEVLFLFLRTLFVKEFACEIYSVDELTCLADVIAKYFFVVSKWLCWIDWFVLSDCDDVFDPIILVLESLHQVVKLSLLLSENIVT